MYIHLCRRLFLFYCSFLSNKKPKYKKEKILLFFFKDFLRTNGGGGWRVWRQKINRDIHTLYKIYRISSKIIKIYTLKDSIQFLSSLTFRFIRFIFARTIGYRLIIFQFRDDPSYYLIHVYYNYSLVKTGIRWISRS